MASLVTEALTQEEPQLHVQPGAARNGVSMDGKKQGDNVRLTHCEETDVCFGLRKVGVLLPTRMKIQCGFVWKTCSRLGFWEKAKGKVGGALSNLYPEPMHGFGRLVGLFQSTRSEVGALTLAFDHTITVSWYWTIFARPTKRVESNPLDSLKCH
jgi:hypothetical protein